MDFKIELHNNISLNTYGISEITMTMALLISYTFYK